MRTLEFKFERKRIKRDKQLPPLCADYETKDGRDRCVKSEVCKNATYGWEGQAFGSCFGGTKGSEREERKRKEMIANL